MPDEILLITRVRTVNKGNQALSAAWLAMLERAFPATPVRVLERRPRHLLQYTLARIAGERDPVRAFDRIASKLAELAPGTSLINGAPPRTRIVLDETTTPPARFVALRQRLNLRGKLAAAGLYADDYRKRLSACQRAKLVVVNPAGEFFPREPQAAFYHVLDAHVAQKLGRPTAIVNHTMDITDSTLRRIIPAVYRTLALVGFRDEKSVATFREMGGDMSNVLVTPDLALTTQVPVAGALRQRTVAVAINVPEASARGYLAQWHNVIAGLRQTGRTVVLVSNELPVDLPFYREVQARYPGVTLEGAGLDHDRYGELLGGFELVVTSRMHTAVLSMVAGAPVVAVEGSSFKITGMYQELGLEQPVVQPGVDGWTQRIVDEVDRLTADRDQQVRTIRNRITAVRDRISFALVPRLQAAAQSSAAMSAHTRTS